MTYIEFECCKSGMLTQPLHCSFVQERMGSVDNIMDAFRSLHVLVEVPTAWRTILEEQTNATCWYPAHISCQV